MEFTCYNCFQAKPSGGPCPYCGYDRSDDEEKFPIALKAGSILNGRYIVGRVLGQGGFGVTYIAQDYQTKERVAIKEYLPAEFAGRSQSNSVQPYSENAKETFKYGKAQFLEEAKTLAAFNGDEHIVRIYSYFEENNTAYFSMEYVDGYALDKYMIREGGPLSVDEASRLLLPLMLSLDQVHAKGIIHRDIAPDNIIITKLGKAKLIDFGAARYSTGEKSKSLDVILKHGFAPKEQYLRRGRQGPFTDVYALAATYYYAITGKIPPEPIERMDEDDLVPPSSLRIQISAGTEDALFKALEVNAADRYQSMREFYRDMVSGMGQVSASNTADRHSVPDREIERYDNAASRIQQEIEWTEQQEREKRGEEKRLASEKEQNTSETIQKKRSPGTAIVLSAVIAVVALASVFLLPNKAKEPVQKESEPTLSEKDTPATAMESATPETSSDEPDEAIAASVEEQTETEPVGEQQTPEVLEEVTYAVTGGKLTFDPNTRSIVNCDTSVTEAIIPKEINGICVTEIAKRAFQGCEELTAITIPDSIISIGDEAFYDCMSLTEITIPDSVSKIGVNPFNDCYNLTQFHLSADHPYLELIDGVLFSREDSRLICYPCGRTTSEYSVPEGTQIIGKNAFNNCNVLTEIILPNSVTTIGEAAFCYCSNLEKVTVPDSVTEIYGHFYGCPNLTFYVNKGSYAEQYCIEWNGETSDDRKLNYVVITELTASTPEFASWVDIRDITVVQRDDDGSVTADVTVDYVLNQENPAELEIMCNYKDETSYISLDNDKIIIEPGEGAHLFRVSVTPERPGDICMKAYIHPYSHGQSWTAIAHSSPFPLITDTDSVTASGNEEIVVLSDNLILEKVSYQYKTGENQWNPGSVGTLTVTGNVTGPSNLTDVLIASWENAQPTATEASDRAESMISVWQEHGFTPSVRTPPYQISQGRPVFEEDLGKTQYIILVGLDSGINLVGYVVVKVDVPSG